MQNRKALSATKAPKQPAPDALAHHTTATLEARLRELREHLGRNTEETIRLERAHILAADLDDERAHDTRKAGIELLASGGNERFDEARGINDVHRRLALLRRLTRDIHAAIDVGEQRLNVLAIREEAQRWEAGRPEYKRHVRAVWESLVALDRAQTERDLFLRKIRVTASGVECGAGWPLAGRLARNESQTYRYGRACVDCGYLTETEFQRAFEDAQARDAQR